MWSTNQEANEENQNVDARGEWVNENDILVAIVEEGAANMHGDLLACPHIEYHVQMIQVSDKSFRKKHVAFLAIFLALLL